MRAQWAAGSSVTHCHAASAPGTRRSGTATISSEIAVAGTVATFSVDVRDSNGDVVAADTLDLTSSNADDRVSGLTVLTTEAGLRTITVSVNNGVLTTTGTLDVAAAPTAEMTLSAPSSSVAQESSLTFTVAAEDAFGYSVDTQGTVLTSSVATDVIDGLTVSFPSASPHVITATLNGVSTTFTVEVVPAAITNSSAPGSDRLSSTGSTPTGPLGGLALLLLMSGAALAMHRRKLAQG
ncbi:hypothetical protein [Leucobacter sp. W1038]|uniref:hypothetical protein n=1 Tax=Leucobacter sp. W1038 TaxID=3438281 RepID=UPI003D971B60